MTGGTVVLSGELTEFTTEFLIGALGDAYQPGQDLVLDFAGVSFLTSTGIRALIALSQSYRTAGGQVTIVNPQPFVLQVLDISGVAAVFGLDTPANPDGPA